MSINLERLVSVRYPSPRWTTMTELRQGTGYGKGREGRIDVAAFSMWPSDKDRALAFEVKRTRSDFKKEIQNPAKRKWAEEQFGECYFVTPSGLVKPAEVPEGWGLLQATKTGSQLREIVIPKQREVKLSQSLVRSVFRRLGKSMAVPDDALHGDGKCVPVALYKEANQQLEEMRKQMARLRMPYSELEELANISRSYGITEWSPNLVRDLVDAAVTAYLRPERRDLRKAYAALGVLIERATQNP